MRPQDELRRCWEESKDCSGWSSEAAGRGGAGLTRLCLSYFVLEEKVL